MGEPVLSTLRGSSPSWSRCVSGCARFAKGLSCCVARAIGDADTVRQRVRKPRAARSGEWQVGCSNGRRGGERITSTGSEVTVSDSVPLGA
jgi:hypothetical protein